MREPTILSLLTLARSVYPLARELLGHMAVDSMDLRSTTVIRHEVLAKVVLQIMSEHFLAGCFLAGVAA